MQGSGRLDLVKHKITWCLSSFKAVEAFGQALPLFAFFVFMQLGNIAGPSSTAVVLGMTALQPENRYNQTISSQCVQVSAVCLKESWSTWRLNRNLNTCDWNWLSVIIYISKSLLLTSSQKSNASLVWSFFKGVNICWNFFAVVILLCLLSSSPHTAGETLDVHQSTQGRGTKIADSLVHNVLSSEWNPNFSGGQAKLLKQLVFPIRLHTQLKSSRKWSLFQHQVRQVQVFEAGGSLSRVLHISVFS